VAAAAEAAVAAAAARAVAAAAEAAVAAAAARAVAAAAEAAVAAAAVATRAAAVVPLWVSKARPALWVSKARPALWVSKAGAVKVSNITADARFLDAASAAVAVAAEAVGAAELAGYGHPPGVGSTLAGPNPHLRVKKLASRRSRSLKQRLLRKRSDESQPNSSASRQFRIFVIAAAARRYSPQSFAPRRLT